MPESTVARPASKLGPTTHTSRRSAALPWILGVAILVAAVAGGLAVWSSDQRLKAAGADLALGALGLELTRGDAALTNAARNSAASGDLAWEATYNETEVAYVAALQALELAAGEVAHADVQATKAADDQLVAAEREAFRLIRQGDLAQARTLLFSDAYITHVQQSQAGRDGAVSTARAMLAEREAAYGQINNVSAWVLAVTLMVATGATVTLVVQGRRQTRQERQRLMDDANRLQQAVDQRTAQLVASTAQLEQAQALAHVGSWRLDVPTQAVWWSTEMYALYGVQPGTPVTAETFFTRVHPEDAPGLQLRHAAALTNPEVSHFADDVRIVVDGAERFHHVDARIERDTEGRPLVVQGSTQDRTSLKRAAGLEQASRDQIKEAELLTGQAAFKTRFINLAAHELRTPLTPIKLDLFLLRKQTSLLPGGTPKSLESLQRNIDRLSALTQDLVDAANLQSSEIVLHNEVCHLQEKVRRVAEVVAAKAAAKGVSIDVIAPEEVTITGDRTRLQTVLHHVMENAVKFTPRGGRVTIGLRGDAAGAEIVVTDTGAGLTPAQISQLFRPFVQVHNTMEVTDRGAGLGLFIAKTIVELHGGEMSAKSAGPGRGSTFTVRLPKGTLPSDQAPEALIVARGATP